MIRRKQYFDRGDYMLELDTTSGKRVTRMIPKLPTAIAKAKVATGELRVAKQKRPGAIRRAANYGKAVVKHHAAGKPKASQSTVEERFAICQNCPSGKFLSLGAKDTPRQLQHLPQVGTCADASCGCVLHPTKIEPAKLAWADQACPRGHWGKAVGGG